MRHYRFVALLIALLAAFGAQSLIGRSDQTAATGTPPAGGAIPASGPFDSLHFRPIGPAGMSGRISDLAVDEANPAIFYVGTAHGGLWKTTNAGTTFQPLFQDYGLMPVGDATISQSNPDLGALGSGK